MARKSQTVFKLGIGAIAAVGFSSCVISFDASADALTPPVFDLLMQSNSEHWRALREQEVLLAYASRKQKQADERKVLVSEIGNLEKSARGILENILLAKTVSEPAAMAHYQLVLLNLRDKKRRQENIALLKHATSMLKSLKSNGELAVKLNLLAGEVSLSAGLNDAASSYFQASLDYSTLSSTKFSSESARSLTGLADVAFLKFKFADAARNYANAISVLRRAQESKKALSAPEISPLYARLIWSNFKSGNSYASGTWLREYAREANGSSHPLPKSVQEDLNRVAGIVLYERSEPEFYKELSSDKVAGDLAKNFIISAKKSYERASRCLEFEGIAQDVEADFSASKLLMDFFAVRIECAKKSGEREVSHTLEFQAAGWLRQSSAWKRIFQLNETDENRRRALVVRSSESAADYFFNEAQARNSKNLFLKSAQSYEIRLSENLEEEARGRVYLRGSQAAFFGSDWELAWGWGEAALRFPLALSDKKAALFQMVVIAKAQSQDVYGRNDFYAKRYENAVDTFVTALPNDKDARFSLFESARRAESWRDSAESQRRFERNLALLSPNSEIQFEERNKVLSALATVYGKDSLNLDKNSEALSRLEMYALSSTLSVETKDTVLKFNSMFIRLKAHALRRIGKLTASSETLETWARKHHRNPESAAILLSAVRARSDENAWKPVLESSQFFEEHFANSPLISEMRYWFGRGLEAEMRFSEAANSYFYAAAEKNSYLTPQERLEAFKRCYEIDKDLKNSDRILLTLENMADVSLNLGQQRAAETFLLEASSRALQLRKFEKSKQLYAQVVRQESFGFSAKERAKLGVLEAKIFQAKENYVARIEIDSLIENYQRRLPQRTAEDKKKMRSNLVQAVGILTREESDIIDSFKAVEFGKADRVQLKRAAELQKKMNQRIISADRNLVPQEKSKLYLILAKASLKVAEMHIQAAEISANLTASERDFYSKSGGALRKLAQNHFYRAYEDAEEGTASKVTIAHHLSAFTEFKTSREPTLATAEPPSDQAPLLREIVSSIDEVRKK